jgi:Mrp family chromosome partitioning ATPase
MGFVDGVLVVARSGGTRKAAFEAVLEEIEQTEPPFAGIVVNRAQRSQAYFDYYSSSYAVKRKRPLFKRLFAPHQKKSADGSPAEGEIPADQDGYRYAENALEETKELTDLSAKPS